MKKLPCMMMAGSLALVTTVTLALDLTSYETRARKDTVPNTAQLVTDVDMVGLGNAVADAIAVSNGVFGVWFAGLFGRTNYWEGALQPASTNGWETGSHAAFLTAESDTNALAALAEHAAYWPPNATASSWFTFTTNANKITITGYNIDGGTDVVIPDYINGLPVTEIGANAFVESGVTSIGGAGNVVTVGASAFSFCPSLASVSLPQVHTVESFAFSSCYLLTSVSLPQVQTVRAFAFAGCASLASVSLPQVHTVGDSAFSSCTSLASLYFDNDAPTIGADIFANITTNQVTNYVTNPQATGWGATFGGMPVVRLPLHADAITLNGVAHTNWPSADVSGLAPTNSPTILNPTVRGWLALPQSAPTNLVLRLVCSNEHIYVEEVYP